MKISKTRAITFGCAFLLWGIMMFIMFGLVFSGKVTIHYYGFAFDSVGNLYLGKTSKIEVYNKDGFIRTLSPRTSRGYFFTILPNDTLLLSAGSDTITMDLYGNELGKEQSVSSSNGYLFAHATCFCTEDGDVYVMRSLWGRTQIVLNDTEVVYEMPLFDYIVKLVWKNIFWIIAVLVIIIITDGHPRKWYNSNVKGKPIFSFRWNW